MEEKFKLESGNWTGFYLEPLNSSRGWMHLYLEFGPDDKLAGEGTDYVGPWQAIGVVDEATQSVRWVKQYMGKHKVFYEGQVTDRGIVGTWKISSWLAGQFHIWPTSRGDIQAQYLEEETPRKQL